MGVVGFVENQPDGTVKIVAEWGGNLGGVCRESIAVGRSSDKNNAG